LANIKSELSIFIRDKKKSFDNNWRRHKFMFKEEYVIGLKLYVSLL